MNNNLFVLDPDAVTSAAGEIKELATKMSSLSDTVKGFSSDGGKFDFTGAKNRIAENIDACATKIKNTYNYIETAAKSHTTVQNSLIKPGASDVSANPTYSGGNYTYSASNYAGMGGFGYDIPSSYGTPTTNGSTPLSNSGGATTKDPTPVNITSQITSIDYLTLKTEELSEDTKKILDMENFHFEKGIAMLGTYYLIACDSSIGKVGDVIRFTLKDGTVIECIVMYNTDDEKDKNSIKFLKEKDDVEPLEFTEKLLENAEKIENLGNCEKVLNIKLPVTYTTSEAFYATIDHPNSNYQGHTVELTADQYLKVARCVFAEQEGGDFAMYVGLCQYIRDYIDYGSLARSYDNLGSFWLTRGGKISSSIDIEWLKQNKPEVIEAVDYVFGQGGSLAQNVMCYYYDDDDAAIQGSAEAANNHLMSVACGGNHYHDYVKTYVNDSEWTVFAFGYGR